MRLTERQVNVLTATALLALAPLAWLQYRWISEVSEADQFRRKEGVESALDRVSVEVQRDAARLLGVLALAGPEEMGRRSLPVDGLPWTQILVLTPSNGDWSAQTWDPAAGTVAPASVPEWWTPRPLREGLIHRDPPALLAPIRGEERPPRFVVVLLDRAAIESEYLPAEVERHLGAGLSAEYTVAIVPGNGAAGGAADASVEILAGVRPMAALRGRRRGREGFGGPRGMGPVTGPGLWSIHMRHREGSLDHVAIRTRNRNLVISGLSLLLLGGAISALNAGIRRARRLADQQLAFTAGVSHELKTPLAVIVSAGDNLAGGFVAAPERVREYGALVRDEGTRLTTMVDQVLRFAALQAEAMPLDRREAALDELVAKVAAGFPEMATGSCALSPVKAAVDAEALSVAVRNLIENAIRHGGGSVEVATRATPEGAEITVSDRGPGIPASERDRLFAPFYRGAASRAAGRKGTGLGLALVQRIIEAHGGSVVAENRSGGGARFTLKIPGTGDGAAATD